MVGFRFRQFKSGHLSAPRFQHCPDQRLPFPRRAVHVRQVGPEVSAKAVQLVAGVAIMFLPRQPALRYFEGANARVVPDGVQVDAKREREEGEAQCRKDVDGLQSHGAVSRGSIQV